jgi:tRNA uridine 5-carboxymethylaminomethyl modification enzyme
LKTSEKHSLLDPEQIFEINSIQERLNIIVSSLDTTLELEHTNRILANCKESPVRQKTTAKRLLTRPSVGIADLPEAVFNKTKKPKIPAHFLSESYIEAEAIVKYDGYIKRQNKQVLRMKKQENVLIPNKFDYLRIGGLSSEAREKLTRIRPETLGQAQRISGITPADISILSVMLVA